MVPVLVSTWVQPIVLMITSRYASGLTGRRGVGHRLRNESLPDHRRRFRPVGDECHLSEDVAAVRPDDIAV